MTPDSASAGLSFTTTIWLSQPVSPAASSVMVSFPAVRTGVVSGAVLSMLSPLTVADEVLSAASTAVPTTA